MVQVRRFLNSVVLTSSVIYPTAALGVLCYRDFTSCTRRVSVSHFHLSAFVPSCPCPHRIRDRNCCRFNGIDSRWDATDVNPSFRLPRRESSSIGFDLCDEITCPPALCAIISPAAPLSLSLQSYPVLKEESPRRVKADERRSRTSARKAEIDFFSCTRHLG